MWNVCMTLKAITCTIFFNYYYVILNWISESPCSLYSLRPACPDPNEACYEQNNSTAVCICKPGYSKQHHEEPCKLTRPSTATNSHSEDQPTMPEAEHSTKISGNDETCRLVHTYWCLGDVLPPFVGGSPRRADLNYPGGGGILFLWTLTPLYQSIWHHPRGWRPLWALLWETQGSTAF
jgi:hypothetical protein